MLQRRVSNDGVVYYASPLLEEAGVKHAFSTRIGGISPAPFDSMNLGNPNGCAIQDDYEHVWENYRILQKAIGCGEHALCRVHQVHGKRVVRVVKGEAFDTAQEADGIASDDPGRVVSVRVADCVPILLSSDTGRIVAAVHAGWRGVVADVVGAAMDVMGVRPGEVIAAIGPCIGFEAFEVGMEVIEEFVRVFGDEAPIRRRSDGKGHVDLREAVRRQLMRHGVSGTRIDVTDRCTVRDAEEFFSHRRQNGVAGRMAALIAAKAGMGTKS